MLDVLARDLEQARAALEAAGYHVEVVDTRTPRHVTLTGKRRVLRQQATDRLMRLVVTHERYVPAG
ncbi:MAG: hypothetical protein ACRDIC_04045 [bacterium]